MQEPEYLAKHKAKCLAKYHKRKYGPEYQTIVKAKEQERESIRTRTSKKCKTCGNEKILKENTKAEGTIDGHYGSCKDCRGLADRERVRERRRKHRETPEYQLEVKAREDRKQERLRFLCRIREGVVTVAKRNR